MNVGTRRLAAVLVAAACVAGSARLWSDALTPTASRFVEPSAQGGGSSALPQTVIVAAAEPQAVPRAPHRAAVTKPAHRTPTGRTGVRFVPAPVTAPAHAATHGSGTPAKTV